MRHYQVDGLTTWNNDLEVMWNPTSPQVTLTCSKINPTTIQCEIPDAEVVDRKYRVRYENNAYFADNLVNAVDLNIVAIPVELKSFASGADRDFPEETISCIWMGSSGNCGTYGWPNDGVDVAYVDREYSLNFEVGAEKGITAEVEGYITIDFDFHPKLQRCGNKWKCNIHGRV